MSTMKRQWNGKYCL